MRAPYTQLYLHCAWATWDREPLVTPLIEQPVYAFVLAKTRELRCVPLAIGGTADHVHLLVRWASTISVADFVGEVKGSSSHFVGHQLVPGGSFKWQGAYGAFTVSQDHVGAVRDYIRRQKEHHAMRTLVPVWEQTLDERTDAQSQPTRGVSDGAAK